MKQHKDHQEEEEEEEEEEEKLSMKKEGALNKRDGKNHEKSDAVRSTHSVAEQRRRSKINERFQILRDLIPHSEQKRDTASFLLEVIEYVQYLQEKVQKYEGSYQGLTPEPTKLMPWSNSHWRVQSFVSHSQAINNGSGPGSAFSGKFDENNINMTSRLLVKAQNPVESDLSRDASCKAMDHHSEFDKAVVMPMSLQSNMSAPVQSGGGLVHALQGPVSDAQLADCPITCETLSRKDLMIEGGTINISSAYSQGYLSGRWFCFVHIFRLVMMGLHLWRYLGQQFFKSCGVDLSQASISVQIDIGKRANRGLTSGTSIVKDHENPPPTNDLMGHHHRDASSAEDSDQSQKRLKT